VFNRTKLLLDKLLFIVSTNLLALGVIGLFDSLYFAAYWYWNFDLGRLPNLLAIGLLVVVNLWLFSHPRLK
jgi:hypothetical protein